MLSKHYFKVLSIVAVLAMMFSNIQPSVAQAQSKDLVQRHQTLHVNGDQTPLHTANGNEGNIKDVTTKTHTLVVHPMPDKKWDQVSTPSQHSIAPLERSLDARPSSENSLDILAATESTETKSGPPSDAQSTTGPVPPAGAVSTDSLQYVPGVDATVLSGVPSYIWHHGCGPTAAGMLIGYWDSHGYDWLISGSAATQTTAVDEAIASSIGSQNHYTDYALPMDSGTPTILPDKSELPVGDEHLDNSIADFMHTSQSSHYNRYGWSWFSDFGPSMVDYVRLNNPGGFAANSTNLYYNSGLNWDVFKAEIDAGRPVGLLVDSSADGSTDHFIPAFGYDDSSGTPMYAAYNTWDTSLHWYEFGPMTVGKSFGIFGAITFELGTSPALPTILSRLTLNQITTLDWPNGTELALTVEDPNTVTSPDYVDNSQIAQLNDPMDPFSGTYADFELGAAYILKSGDEVSIEGGGITVSMIIADIHVTNVDADSDTISGTAGDGIDEVSVSVWTSADWTVVNADVVDHVWTADFTGIYDIGPGDNGTARWWDLNENMTADYWSVPDPTFAVRANFDSIEGWEWPNGSTVTIEIDNNGDGLPEASGTAPVGPAPWNPAEIRFDYNFAGAYDIQPGDDVTVTDGNTTRSTTVTELAFTDIDQDTDIVTGTATPGAYVNIWICDNSGCDHNRHVTANGTTGVWQADFGHVGIQWDEQTLADIQPGTWIDSSEYDNDGDSTMYGINVPNPYFNVRANDNLVEGWEWPLGSTVTVEVSRPGETISRTATVEAHAPWDPYSTSFFSYGFTGEFDIQPGDVVSVTDGATTKTTTVTSLAFTNINLDTDAVTGVATPGANVDIWVCNDTCDYNRHVTADETTGIWEADFGHVGSEDDEKTIANLGPGTWIDSIEQDGNGDGTMYGVTVPNPHIEASVLSNWVQAREWPKGTLMTLRIDDLSNGLGAVDYTKTTLMDQAPWNPNDPNDIVADFDMSGFTLEAGDVITVFGTLNGSTKTKVLTASELHSTAFDMNADTVSGVATAGQDVQVCVNIPYNCISRWVTADSGDGTWTVDYSAQYDLLPGDTGWAADYDDDADRTFYDWRIPNPRFDAWFRDGWISAYDWPLGTQLTLEIEDPNTNLSPDYSTATDVIVAPWDPTTTLGEFDINGAFVIEPGMTISISGASITKDLIVSRLSIILVDPVHDVIKGGTEPNQNMWMWFSDSCCRGFQADSKGAWMVDYSVPGDGGEPIADVGPDSSGTINAVDNDGDNTSLNWYVPERAYMNVTIGGHSKGDYALDHSDSEREFYVANSGPVKVANWNYLPTLASQRVIFGGKSYSEMMGLPAEQLSKEYWFPYYNNVAMDSQLRVSNLGNVPTNINVYLGIQKIDSFTLGGNGAIRKNYSGKNGGPLRVTSSATNVLSTIRVLYGGNSYSELMGLPKEQLAKEYLFPYYNNVAMDSQLRVSNLGGGPTTITVYLGKQQIDNYTLAGGSASRKNYSGKNGGPLRVTSSATNILSTIRVLFNGNSYSELMGYPANQVAQEYWYPVYDNSILDSQLRVSNVGDGPTTIKVYAGGLQIDSYSLGAGAASRKNYAKNTGPLQVVSSSEPILSTIRMMYTTPGYSSYYEMTGLPDTQLSTQYFFPWYNNAAMNSELRFAVP